MLAAAKARAKAAAAGRAREPRTGEARGVAREATPARGRARARWRRASPSGHRRGEGGRRRGAATVWSENAASPPRATRGKYFRASRRVSSHARRSFSSSAFPLAPPRPARDHRHGRRRADGPRDAQGAPIVPPEASRVRRAALAALAAFVIGGARSKEARATEQLAAEPSAPRTETNRDRRGGRRSPPPRVRDAARPAHASACATPRAASAEDDRCGCKRRRGVPLLLAAAAARAWRAASSNPRRKRLEQPATALEDRVDPNATARARARDALMRDLAAAPRGARRDHLRRREDPRRQRAAGRSTSAPSEGPTSSAPGRRHPRGDASVERRRRHSFGGAVGGSSPRRTTSRSPSRSTAALALGCGSWKVARTLECSNALLEMGYDVLMSDVDVVWRRDPRPYLQRARKRRARL